MTVGDHGALANVSQAELVHWVFPLLIAMGTGTVSRGQAAEKFPGQNPGAQRTVMRGR